MIQLKTKANSKSNKNLKRNYGHSMTNFGSFWKKWRRLTLNNWSVVKSDRIMIVGYDVVIVIMG